MQAGSLVLTRRSFGLVQGGLAACVASFLLLLLLPVAPLFGAEAQRVSAGLRALSDGAFRVGPILMAAGVFLGAAAPRISGVPRRAVVTLLVAAGLQAWAPVCYAADLPARFLGGTAGHLGAFVPVILAIGWATMLAALCRWVVSVERSDVEDAEPGRVMAADTDDVVAWEALAGRSARLVWWGVVFLLVALGLDQALPWLARLGMGPREAAITAVIAVPVMAVWGIVLVARLGMLSGAVASAMHRGGERPPGADAAWTRVPGDRLAPAALAAGALVAAAFAGDVLAERSLGPAWRQRHLGEQMAVAASAVGRRAPEMTMTTLDGEPIRLGRLRGTVVVLNFWATWCPPCLAELDALERVARDLERDGGLLIGISAEDPATLRRFLEARPLPYPIVSGSDWPAPFAALTAIPATYVIDAEGTIVEEMVGGRDEAALREAVRKARAGAAAAGAGPAAGMVE